MRYRILKKFTMKEGGQVQTLPPGGFIDLDEAKAARLLQAGVITETDTDLGQMEKEYFKYLSRFWDLDDDPTATIEEARVLLARLEILFQELHRQGRRVPVRLPIERNKHNPAEKAERKEQGHAL
jgi:hypothetical protein